MSEQPYPQNVASSRGRLISISLFAGYCLVALAITLIAPHKDFAAFYINALASFSMLGGVPGLLIVIARLRGWPLPSFLQVPEEERDVSWRLLVLSLIAITMPLLMLIVRYGVLHQ